MAANSTIPADYADIEIRILAREAAGYPVELTVSGQQEFGRGYLRADVLPWVPSDDLAADGARLLDSVLADAPLREAWAELRGRYHRCRIRLRIDAAAPELHALPWELLRDAPVGSPERLVAADAASPFSRYLAGKWAPGQIVTARPLRMLVAIANPSDLAEYGLAPLDVERERQAIEAVTRAAPARDLDVTFLEAPVTLDRLEAALQDGYHFLHIVAHGVYRAGQGQAFLFLAGADNRVARVSDAELAQTVSRQAHPVQLIFLASCQSATRSPEDAFRGLAPRLVQAGVPAVLAMQGLAPVDVARGFAQVFYTGLLRHGMVDLAGNEARSALISAGFEEGWEIPALYMRVPDGRILVPRPGILDRIRSQPLLAAILFLSALTVLLLTLGLPAQLAAARRTGGPLARMLPLPTPTTAPLPENSFNIAVAQFAPIGAAPRDVDLTEASKTLSNWLFEGLIGPQNLYADLPANFRSPAEVGVIDGATQEEREANAKRVAAENNATVVIYGQVTVDDSGLSFAPQFYVSERGYGYGFSYGNEITGPSRLGDKVRFSLPLRDDPVAQSDRNRDLKSRLRALQYLISGLNYFYWGKYADAGNRFDSATRELPADKGQEVALLLLAAAQLRQADVTPEAGRARILDDAEAALRAARQDRPDYARTYLALGGVALARAQLAAGYSKDAQVFADNLIQAAQQYSWALNAAEQPPSAHVPSRALFGLAQVEYSGYRNSSVFCKLEGCMGGWTAEAGRRLFDQVIQAYESQPSAEDLVWFAGMAHCLKGQLSQGLDQYETRAAECQKGAELLGKIRADPPTAWIARFWAEVGGAKGKLYLSNHDPALQAQGVAAFRSAIRLGENLGSSAALDKSELDRWKRDLDALQKGESPGGS